MQDLRVPMDPILSAFGVPATVTRPGPDDDPIETAVVWITPEPADVPPGGSFQAVEPQRMLGIDKATVPTVPKRTRIAAPEVLDGPVKNWLVDGTDRVEPDMVVVVVVPDLPEV